VLGEDLADLLGDRFVDLETGLNEDEIRALPLCGDRRHGRPNAELARFIARRRHDSAFAGPADGDRLAAQVRIVSLFDRGVERVE
jgi:hypothetical protein